MNLEKSSTAAVPIENVPMKRSHGHACQRNDAITRLIPNLLTIPAAGNARMMLTTVNDVMSHPKVLTSRPNACMSTGAIGGTLNMLMGTEQLARNTTMSITHAYGGVLAISCPVPFFCLRNCLRH